MSFVKRIKRYVRTWFWLFRFAFAIYPWLISLSFVSGVFARLGTVVGFILTIKCASLILAPQSLDGGWLSYFPFDEAYLLVLFCLAPSVAFMLAAACQKIHQIVETRVVVEISDRVILEKMRLDVNNIDTAQLCNVKTASNFVSNALFSHKSMISVFTLLFKVISNILITTLTLSIGFFLNWPMMVVLLGVAVVVSGGFGFFLHRKSIQTKNQLEIEKKILSSRMADIKSLTFNDADAATERKSLYEALADSIPYYSKVHKIQKESDSNTAVINEIIQSVIIASFLATLVSYVGTGGSQISNIIILALLLRFLVSYLKSIMQNLAKLGPHYTFVVNLKNNFMVNN